MKYDVTALAKIDQKTLIEAAKKMGIKSPNKVAKDVLITAFLEAVEVDPNVCPADVIQEYNLVVVTLGLDKEPGEEAGGATEESKTPAPETPGPKPVASKPTPVAKPAPVAKPIPKTAPKPAKPPKELKPPKEVSEKYTRAKALIDSFQELGDSGTMEDLVKTSNQKYFDKKGSNVIGDARLYAFLCLEVMTGLGVATLSEDRKQYTILRT